MKTGDVEVIENLEALANLTGDNEGILRAAIDYIARLEQRERELMDGVKRIEQFALDGKNRTAISALIEITQIARVLLKDTKQ